MQTNDNAIDLSGQVAIVTGAGQGLGRAHAVALARRGAKVLVNDLGKGGSAPDAALAVVAEIEAAGGEAVADGTNVADIEQVEAMAAGATARWGRVDILVNNAGILRDRSFTKMTMSEFREVIEVHLIGSASCAKAVWGTMREQAYGRIVFTTSGTGLWGNFGQANYAAAKMGMVGLMNTLHIEGAKYNIRVNCLAPTAGTAMMEGLVSDEVFQILTPESVSPGVVFLTGPDAPSKAVLCAGGGSYAMYKGFETRGVTLGRDDNTAEQLAAAWSCVVDEEGMQTNDAAFRQTERYVNNLK
ncbi:MAG: SDR family NAD(P)-dependent oxidoreductase [Pseudomonadota bacterium]